MVVFGGVNPNEDLKDVAVLRSGEEPMGNSRSAIAEQGGTSVVVEELPDDGTMGHEIAVVTSTIQHKEGLVELKISETTQ